MFPGGDGETPGAHFNLEMVAQLVKNLAVMQETWDQISWKREWLPTPVIWPGEFHGLFHMVAKSQTQLRDFYFHFHETKSNDLPV